MVRESPAIIAYGSLSDPTVPRFGCVEVRTRGNDESQTGGLAGTFPLHPSYSLRAQDDDRNTNDAKALYEQGGRLSAAGEYGRAAESYNKAVLLAPDMADAHNGLCVAYAALGRYDAALNSCARALSLRPDFFDAQQNLGEVYLEMKDRDAALEQQRALQGLDPSLAERLFDLIYKDRVVNVRSK